MNGAKVSKNMSIGAGVIGIILLACGFASCICGFIFTKYGGGANGIWSGIAVSLSIVFHSCAHMFYTYPSIF